RGVLNKLDPIVSEQELYDALVKVLSGYFGEQVGLKKIERRVSDYCSSYIIEELDLELHDGRRLELIFKDLSEQAMLTEASQSKPFFCYDPLREIETYRDILAQQRLGTAEFYGS